MADRDKVIAGLMMLSDIKNDNVCEGLKCCKIAEDAIALLKEQEEIIAKYRKADEFLYAHGWKWDAIKQESDF